MKVLICMIALISTVSSFAQENCTAAKKKNLCSKESLVEQVNKGCKVLEEKGQAGIDELRKYRFDCCGELNYVWVQKDVTMVMHPVSPKIEKDYRNAEENDLKKLMHDLEKVVNTSKDGSGWHEYKWMKMGEVEKSDKTSFIRKCKTKEGWMVGAGSWK